MCGAYVLCALLAEHSEEEEGGKGILIKTNVFQAHLESITFKSGLNADMFFLKRYVKLP